MKKISAQELLDKKTEVYETVSVMSLFKTRFAKKARFNSCATLLDWLRLLDQGYIDATPPGQRDEKEGQIWSDRDKKSFISSIKNNTANFRFLIRLAMVGGRLMIHVYDGGNRNRLLLAILAGKIPGFSREDLISFAKTHEVSCDTLVNHNKKETLKVYREYNTAKVLKKGEIFKTIESEVFDSILEHGKNTIYAKNNRGYVCIENYTNSRQAHVEHTVREILYLNGSSIQDPEDIVKMFETPGKEPKKGIKLWKNFTLEMSQSDIIFNKKDKKFTIYALNFYFKKGLIVGNWNLFKHLLQDVNEMKENDMGKASRVNIYLGYKASLETMEPRSKGDLEKFLLSNAKKYGMIRK